MQASGHGAVCFPRFRQLKCRELGASGQRQAANSCQLASDERWEGGWGGGGSERGVNAGSGCSPVGGREEGVGEGGRGRLQTVGNAALLIVGCCDRDNG